MIDIKHGFYFSYCLLSLMMMMFAKALKYNIKLTNATQTHRNERQIQMDKLSSHV